MNRTRLAIGAGAVTVTAALALTATTMPAFAGHRHGSGSPTTKAPTTTTLPAPTSATFGYSLTMTGLPGSTDPLNVSGSMALDLTAKRAQVSAQLSRPVGPIGTDPITLIAADNTMYVNAPGLSLLTGGKLWVSITGHGIPAATEASSSWGRLASALGNVPAAISWATSHPGGHPMATVTSSSTTDGSTTTALQITLPKGKAKAMGIGLPTTLPISVTADPQGRMTALSSSFAVGGASISFSATSTGYDAPVSISAPAAADTFVVSPSMLSMITGALGLPGTKSSGHGHTTHHALIAGAAAAAKSAGHSLSGWIHSLDRDDS